MPYVEEEKRVVARFDPRTDMLRLLESMRYKEASSEGKTLWLNEVLTWDDLGGRRLPTLSALTWLGDGSPRAVFTVEEVIYNVDVKSSMNADGS